MLSDGRALLEVTGTVPGVMSAQGAAKTLRVVAIFDPSNQSFIVVTNEVTSEPDGTVTMQLLATRKSVYRVSGMTDMTAAAAEYAAMVKKYNAQDGTDGSFALYAAAVGDYVNAAAAARSQERQPIDRTIDGASWLHMGALPAAAMNCGYLSQLDGSSLVCPIFDSGYWICRSSNGGAGWSRGARIYPSDGVAEDIGGMVPSLAYSMTRMRSFNLLVPMGTAASTNAFAAAAYYSTANARRPGRLYQG